MGAPSLLIWIYLQSYYIITSISRYTRKDVSLEKFCFSSSLVSINVAEKFHQKLFAPFIKYYAFSYLSPSKYPEIRLFKNHAMDFPCSPVVKTSNAGDTFQSLVREWNPTSCTVCPKKTKESCCLKRPLHLASTIGFEGYCFSSLPTGSG